MQVIQLCNVILIILLFNELKKTNLLSFLVRVHTYIPTNLQCLYALQYLCSYTICLATFKTLGIRCTYLPRHNDGKVSQSTKQSVSSSST